MKIVCNPKPKTKPEPEIELRLVQESDDSIVVKAFQDGDFVMAGNVCDFRIENGKIVLFRRYAVNDKFFHRDCSQIKVS